MTVSFGHALEVIEALALVAIMAALVVWDIVRRLRGSHKRPEPRWKRILFG